MIIWLNGPFGIGKSTTAQALVRRLPQAVLFDPEPFGAALRQAVANIETATDFQDLRAWLALVVETARILRQTYAETLIVPLTVLSAASAEALAARLATVDPEVHRFRLVAPEATLRARILQRPEIDGPHAWCLDHLEAGKLLMANPAFGEAVSTDDHGPGDVAALIIATVAAPPATLDEPRAVERPTLYGRRVVLRGPRPSDRLDRAHWGTHPDIVRMYGGQPADLSSTSVSAEAVQHWYAELSSDALRWVIEAGSRCIGQVRLHSLDLKDRRARLAIGLLEPELLGQGYGTEATRLVLGHAFDELRLHRVDLRVLGFNTRAIRAYEKCGFIREGLERESTFVAGQWASDTMMSILEAEYRCLKPTWD